MSNEPLVSIGLPTFNRALTLRRAIESALTQNYHNIELIICDNASVDETQAVCFQASQRDSRVKVVRKPNNQGSLANFREVLNQASGEFFMWLADDDWITPTYVTECVKILATHRGHALVCGKSRYFDGERLAFEEPALTLSDDSDVKRVLAYYNQVVWNGTFYGVMWRESLIKLPLQETFGCDWLLLADLAFTGKVETLKHVAINRSLKGASRDVSEMARDFRLKGFVARYPHLEIAVGAWKNIVLRSSVYDALSLPSRLLLGCRVFATICKRFVLARWYGQALAKVSESHPRLKRAAKLVKK